MDPMLVAMRLLHVGLGVFWAGALIFIALFLQPSVRDAGPDGAKVMAGIMRRRFLDIMPVVALVTILSGLWLYWRASAGFQPAYMGSPMGTTIGIGALAALAAFGIGVGVMRPAVKRAAALSQGAPPDDAGMAAAQALRARAATAGRIVAALLAVAVIAMAVARYV